MLVDINLLPKKEPRNIATFIITISVVVILFASAIYFYWQITTTKQQANHLQQEVNVMTEILTLEQQKLTQFTSMNAVKELENAISWTEKQQIDVQFIVQQLTKLLPERGFILEFAYNPTEGQFTVQFDTQAEAAYYLSELIEIEWITDATLNERSSEEVELIEDELPEEAAVSADDILPRYIADYHVKINEEKVKQLTTKENPGGGERP